MNCRELIFRAPLAWGAAGGSVLWSLWGGTGCDSTATLISNKTHFKSVYVAALRPADLEHPDGQNFILSTLLEDSGLSTRKSSRDPDLIRPGDLLFTASVEADPATGAGSIKDVASGDVTALYQGYTFNPFCAVAYPGNGALGEICPSGSSTNLNINIPQNGVKYQGRVERSEELGVAVILDRSLSFIGFSEVEGQATTHPKYDPNDKIPLAASTFVKKLPAKDRFAIFTYGGGTSNVFQALPDSTGVYLSKNRDEATDKLTKAATPSKGTFVWEAVVAAAEHLRAALAAGENFKPAIVLFTDGIDPFYFPEFGACDTVFAPQSSPDAYCAVKKANTSCDEQLHLCVSTRVDMQESLATARAALMGQAGDVVIPIYILHLISYDLTHREHRYQELAWATGGAYWYGDNPGALEGLYRPQLQYLIHGSWDVELDISNLPKGSDVGLSGVLAVSLEKGQDAEHYDMNIAAGEDFTESTYDRRLVIPKEIIPD